MGCVRVIPFVGSALLLLSGCQDYKGILNGRQGPPSVYDAADISAIAGRHQSVLKKLAEDAGIAWPIPEATKADFYKLTLAGFNVVDDQCTAYMEDLFGWERQRNRTRDILALGASTAATVLGMTNAGQKSLVLTAQAFGFASGAWTIVADSYLYKISPATINAIEAKLQAAYRAEAFKNRTTIDSSASAYQYLRGYLNLCLPVTIENTVSEYLAKTKGGANVPVAAATTGQQIQIMGVLPNQTALSTTPAGATPDVSLVPAF